MGELVMSARERRRLVRHAYSAPILENRDYDLPTPAGAGYAKTSEPVCQGLK